MHILGLVVCTYLLYIHLDLTVLLCCVLSLPYKSWNEQHIRFRIISLPAVILRKYSIWLFYSAVWYSVESMMTDCSTTHNTTEPNEMMFSTKKGQYLSNKNYMYILYTIIIHPWRGGCLNHLFISMNQTNPQTLQRRSEQMSTTE